MVRQKADGELRRPDGSVVTGATEVTREVEGLLGLTCDQFTQVAMIAQGDFRKLLEAHTDERIKIFRQIFDTGLYQTLQDRLKEAAGELKRSCDALTENVRRDGAAIQYAGDSEHREIAEQARQGELPNGELVPLLDRLLAEDSTAKDALEEKQGEIGREMEKLIARIKQGELRKEHQKGLSAAQEKPCAAGAADRGRRQSAGGSPGPSGGDPPAGSPGRPAGGQAAPVWPAPGADRTNFRPGETDHLGGTAADGGAGRAGADNGALGKGQGGAAEAGRRGFGGGTGQT